MNDRNERDRYLTEVIGGCYHEFEKSNSPRVTIDDRDLCLVCNQRISLDYSNPNFSTWNGFGKLIEFIWNNNNFLPWQFLYWLQERYHDVGITNLTDGNRFVINFSLIKDKERLADDLYEYLKEISYDKDIEV